MLVRGQTLGPRLRHHPRQELLGHVGFQQPAAVGNPLLIEIKRSILDKEPQTAAFAQVSLYLGESGSRWALLLYAEGPPPDDRLWSKCPPIP
jgi:hypothetical protein